MANRDANKLRTDEIVRIRANVVFRNDFARKNGVFDRKTEQSQG